MVSFEESHELLWELAGVQVATKHVERAAKRLGDEIVEDEKRFVDPPACEAAVAPTMYLGMDGTGVPEGGIEALNLSDVRDRIGKIDIMERK